MDLKPNEQVRLNLGAEQRWWTVRAADTRYAIVTRQAPFRPKGEFEYSILDSTTGNAGPSNLIGNGFWNRGEDITVGAERLLGDLNAGRVEISRRSMLPGFEIRDHRVI